MTRAMASNSASLNDHGECESALQTEIVTDKEPRARVAVCQVGPFSPHDHHLPAAEQTPRISRYTVSLDRKGPLKGAERISILARFCFP
jgi:hypothetical protein